ncbi:unnamed protein product [Ectocarpus sp. 4 AP-2014]
MSGSRGPKVALVVIVVWCILAMFTLWTPTSRDSEETESSSFAEHGYDRKLAVIVPIHEGDSDRAMAALSKWPTTCYSNTLMGMDLIIYKAEAISSASRLTTVPDRASLCFRNTKIVSANLRPEDNVYPKGSSVMFYKLYLDSHVVASLAEYDALAIVEWDIIVAHSSSFSRLYEAAFFSSEWFWVKGSTLSGTEFHQTATLTKMWHILGHLNGNAIYNNTDLAFTEFVNFTLSRWEYKFSYDVALWATMADFPYSWPIWQRYSSRFVATTLISNIGFFDVNDHHVAKAISQDTLFIHGNSQSRGSVENAKTGGSLGSHHGRNKCTDACGAEHLSAIPAGVSTLCDESCSAEWSSAGPRFGGHNCGAGSTSRYGSDCRLCYTDQEGALAADIKLGLSSVNTSAPKSHVIMCDTGHPPPAASCSAACEATPDTVCDYRCGSGLHGDLYCNWRDLGDTCRLCFNEGLAAHLADEVAIAQGARVILCNTHEPPIRSEPEMERLIDESERSRTAAANRSLGESEESEEDLLSPAEISSRGEMCAFMGGYFDFMSETTSSVHSVLEFMEGMRIAIATHPMDFHVFNRTLGDLPGVVVTNATSVEYAALEADRFCGTGTRLIYFMEVGQILSRTFSPKDTHTARGDLIVVAEEVHDVHIENAARAMGSVIVLGFATPTFTYGSDLILPAEINGQLRAVLGAKARLGAQTDAALPTNAKEETDRMYAHIALVADLHRGYASIYVPEVLAALAYSSRPKGVDFINIREWHRDNLFSAPSIWEIPLVKPRFGCTFDASLGLRGYRVGDTIAKELEAFKLGASCELGYRKIAKSGLEVNTHWEFGPEGANTPLPNLRDYNISVMYRTFSGDAMLFNISLASLIDRFPSAMEVVVVVVESDKALFESIVEPFRAVGPLPIHVVAEPELMDGHVQQKYSKVRIHVCTDAVVEVHVRNTRQHFGL